MLGVIAAVFNSILFSVLGVGIFWVSFLVVDTLTPYQLWKELCENRNTALAIVVAALALGISLIIAAAIHG